MCYIDIYIHVYIHIHTHTYMHIYIIYFANILLEKNKNIICITVL